MNLRGLKKVNWNIILVLLIYSFITVTHLVLLQPFRSQNFSINHPKNSIFKRKEISSASTGMVLRRMEKVIIEDNSISFSSVAFAVCISFLFIISFFEALKRRRNIFPADPFSLFSNQYAYLSLCTFRI